MPDTPVPSAATEATDLAALTALLDGATGGEWETDGAEIRVKDGYDMYGDRLWIGETCALRSTDDANATLIAALRNAAPGLIAEVTELRRKVEAVEALHEKRGTEGSEFCAYDSEIWPCPTIRAALETA